MGYVNKSEYCRLEWFESIYEIDKIFLKYLI